MRRLLALGLAASAAIGAPDASVATGAPAAVAASAAPAASAATAATAATGGDTPGAQRGAASGALVELFTGTCLPYAGDVRGLRAALAERRVPAMPAARARTLLVWPGVVFPIALAAQHLAVLSFDNGLCGTIAEDVDPGTLIAALAAAMKRSGIAVSALGVAPAGAAQAYRLVGPRTRVELMLDIEPAGDRTQASMLAKPLPATAP